MLCRTYMGGVFSPLLASFVGVYLQRFIIVLFPGSHVPGNKTTKDLCTLLYSLRSSSLFGSDAFIFSHKVHRMHDVNLV